jgi:hypothetical protein
MRWYQSWCVSAKGAHAIASYEHTGGFVFPLRALRKRWETPEKLTVEFCEAAAYDAAQLR